jgi:hypothetical protein
VSSREHGLGLVKTGGGLGVGGKLFQKRIVAQGSLLACTALTVTLPAPFGNSYVHYLRGCKLSIQNKGTRDTARRCSLFTPTSLSLPSPSALPLAARNSGLPGHFLRVPVSLTHIHPCVRNISTGGQDINCTSWLLV